MGGGGHGALLRDANGERFVDELKPRDEVSRAMMALILEQGVEHLWLDATGLERFDERFPTIAASVRAVGLDPAADWLPVAPAAHYVSGGVVTDLDGATALPGLWACGEVACTGVHGANRLASNSLLEGMVFGPRVVEAVLAGKDGPEATGAMRDVLDARPDRVLPLRPVGAVRPVGAAGTATPAGTAPEPVKARSVLQHAMTGGAGVLRTAASLAATTATVEAVDAGADPELANLVLVARALLLAATAREETRGCHARTDFPSARPDLASRFVVR